MKQFSLLFFLIVVLNCCASPEKVVVKNPEKQSDSTQIISAPIVEKSFYSKAGKKTDYTEFYIQQSVQDYFIKFCESKVTREELESALSKIDSPIKTLTVKVEFREGHWDSCDDYEMQSRVGKYAVLLGIE